MTPRRPRILPLATLLSGVLTLACGRPHSDAPAPAARSAEATADPARPSPVPAGARPDLLLVTLDTTRADIPADVTPHLTALGARGVRFDQAYATAPQTLPSHASMLTGLYPAGHGVRENARRLSARHELVAERLAKLGYATAAFVSGFPLDAQFGLARGFEVYDDQLPGGIERSARATTDRALDFLSRRAPAGTVGTAAKSASRPLFLWVHYYDPHDAYEPPEPFRARFAHDLYRGEVAAMDEQLGRLLEAFEGRGKDPGAPPRLIVVLADHGEGRGDHGERLHGNLLYQGVMRVPLVVAGTGVAAAERSDAVSARQVFATLLAAAGEPLRGGFLDTPAASAGSQESPESPVVLGEAMQPFLEYHWQPQTMAVSRGLKVIRSGRFEQYDVVTDPGERNDLVAANTPPDRELAREIVRYPVPGAALGPGETSELAEPSQDVADAETRRRLQSLGYLAGGASTPTSVPDDAPRAADRTALYADLDAVSRAFGRGDYRGALPLIERLAQGDPGNPSLALRAAVAHSALGHDVEALRAFARARQVDPESVDARHYEALHHLRAGRPAEAAQLFAQVLAQQPERRAALAALAEIRMREGRTDDAISLFERARAVAGDGFEHDLELGVLYLAARRLDEARDALDRVEPDHPAYAMALFKRAQVAVLLEEPDAAARIQVARDLATPETRELIARERLFAGLQ
jgi:choline-sulfatase